MAKLAVLFPSLSSFASFIFAAYLPRHASLIDRNVDLRTQYDFVIVGGGASGLTVADRLTENPRGTRSAMQTKSRVHTHKYMLNVIYRSIGTRCRIWPIG